MTERQLNKNPKAKNGGQEAEESEQEAEEDAEQGAKPKKNKYKVKASAKPKKDEKKGKASKKKDNDADDELPEINGKADFKNLTIPQLRRLAKDKGKGFLGGVRKREDILKKFEDDWDATHENGDADADSDADSDAAPGPGPNNIQDADDDSDSDDSDQSADDAHDGGIKIPRYKQGDKRGLPNYGAMPIDDLKKLSEPENRDIQWERIYTQKFNKTRKLKIDYVEHLEAQDKEKKRYKNERAALNAKKTKGGKTKRKAPTDTHEGSNKKQKQKATEEEDEGMKEAAQVASPRRKSSGGSAGTTFSRKASLRSASAGARHSSPLEAVQEAAAEDGEDDENDTQEEREEREGSIEFAPFFPGPDGSIDLGNHDLLESSDEEEVGEGDEDAADEDEDESEESEEE